MSRKLLLSASALIGIALLCLSASNVDARGGGGGGHGGGGHGGGGFSGGGFHSSGFSGGGFHSGGFGGSGFHGSAYSGQGHNFSGFSGGNMSHSFNSFASPRFTPGGTRSFNRFGNGDVARMSQGEWRHTQGWNNWGHGQAWDHDHDFDHGHGRFGHWYGFSPFFFPGWYDWYGGPDYYGYGYGPAYYRDYDSGVYGTEVNYATPTTPTTIVQGSVQTGEEYSAQAREAFSGGNYHDALRLAGHAAVEMPRDPAAHELISLALFAMKDYRGAAMEAHAALAMGPPVDWATLYSYYGNVQTYTDQLRALEAYVHENPKAPEGHFLLAYQYTMMGSTDAAKKAIAEAVALAPGDKLAESLMKQLNQP